MKVGIGIGRCKGHSLKDKGEKSSVGVFSRFGTGFEEALDVQELVYN